ncbi:unnamed protein product [Peniophora sp. CBMAI 1063]|nr:unnamed protein product [Peniophora sp. CBMAI 1063]
MGHNKRKRDEGDGDSDEDPLYGMRQILPVASLPANYDGEPVDGMQYLFTVRRDAKLLPAVTRVPNPYELDPPPAPPESEPPVNAVNKVDPAHLSGEWRATYIRRFQGFRNNLSQPTSETSTPTRGKLMPDKKDRDAWWDFISGAPESVWNKAPSKRSTKPKRKSGGGSHGELDPSDPDVIAAGWQVVEPSPQLPCDVNHRNTISSTTSPAEAGPGSSSSTNPREPTPALVLTMDHRMAIHLIMYFTYWINQHLETSDRAHTAAMESYTPLESHARWIFALLARVDSYCSADDMNGLRSLVRACLAYMRSRNTPSNTPLLDHNDGDDDSDIASTPGGQPIGLPATEEPVYSATELPPVAGKEAPALDISSRTPPLMSANSVRLILCAVADFWQQRDLWADADGVFA